LRRVDSLPRALPFAIDVHCVRPLLEVDAALAAHVAVLVHLGQPLQAP
jgi:hypothetical protein